MKATQAQKAQNVNKIIKVLFILIVMLINITTCKSGDNSNDDIYLLDFYVNDYRTEQKKDTIFLGSENYNGDVLKIINRYSLNSEIVPDELKDVFTETNYRYFKKQIIDVNSVWNIDLDKIDYLFTEDNYLGLDKLKILYITKPIYTIDGQYALIMKSHKSDENISFLSSVEVYKNSNNGWNRISKINRY